jgi:peptidyl-prolyl cis-trans isomerase B (cyclophilin B)
VQSFLKLAQQGFYDGIAFHRIVRNYMIQTGCPNTKKGAKGQPGTGGPGYQLPAEFNDIKHTTRHRVDGQDARSEFRGFAVLHRARRARRVPRRPIHGVRQGRSRLEVLDEIASIECDFGASGERSKPKERVEIKSIELRPRQAREPVKEPSGEVEAEGS